MEQKLKELQDATTQMELYRIDPELVDAYNAETVAQKFLPNSLLITKLTGRNQKRVAFVPSGSTAADLSLVDDDVEIIRPTSMTPMREVVMNPLYWDRNWTWDF